MFQDTPRAYKPYSTLDIPVGQTARLECAAHAFPPVTRYSWSYGNRSLPETGPTLSVTPTSSNPVFYGVYTCTATNEVGTSDDVLIKLQETRTTQGPSKCFCIFVLLSLYLFVCESLCLSLCPFVFLYYRSLCISISFTLTLIFLSLSYCISVCLNVFCFH